MAAARRSGARFAAAPPGGHRCVSSLAAAVALVSLPWIAAELGFHLPGDVFLGGGARRERTSRPPPRSISATTTGSTGALLVLSALLLSRVLVGASRATCTRSSSRLMLAYGAVEPRAGLWHEQIVKRGWTDCDIPSRAPPRLKPIWARRASALAVRARSSLAAARQAHGILTRA